MNKKIIFYYDLVPLCYSSSCVHTYSETKYAIKDGDEIIRTTSMANFSFDLIDYGYDIYLSDGRKEIKIEPHMKELEKDLSKHHNILKMFLAGCFNDLFN